MRHETPAPPELGIHHGLAYALFVPEGEPIGGVVILHGAGSCKESHFDFARAARVYGLAALAFDARGHGSSEGVFGDGAIDDVHSICDVLAARAPRLALRGSSMGGFCAINAAAADERVAAVVAICPAPEDLLLRALRSEERELEFEVDQAAAERWLERTSLSDAAAALSPRAALLLMHAREDEQIPYTVSEELHAVAGEPKRLIVVPGGHHRSIQHDGELQGESLRFLTRALRG